MKIINIVSAILLLAPFQLSALTVDEMAQQTLDSNPQIKQHLSELESLGYDLDKAYSEYKPSVDLYGGVGPERTEGKGLGTDDEIDLVASEASLTLTENLFKGFNTVYDVKEQESRIQAAKYFTLQEANSVLLKFITSYLDIVKNRQALLIEYENVKTHERINKMIRNKTELGHGSRTDVEQSEARKILAYSNYIVQQNNYRDSLFNFERYYGKVILGNQMPDAISADLPSYDFDELIQLALEHNPTIRIEEFNIQTQENKYSKSLSSFYPTLDAELSLDYRDDVNGYEFTRRSAKAMLKLNYNLYNGGFDESIRLQNLEAKNAHQYSYEENKRAVEEKLKLAFMSYIHNKKRIKCLELYVKMSKKTAESFSEEYYLGRRTLLDLLNVEQEYTHAQQELLNAKNELYIACYRVLDGVGVTASALHTDLYEVLELDAPELQASSDVNTLLKDLKDDVNFIDLDKACSEPTSLDLGIAEELTKQALVEKLQNNTSDTQGVIIDKTNPDDVKIDLISIQFEYGSADLSEESKPHISTLAERVLKNENSLMEIHGHTDNIGSHAFNDKLSLARAKSAKDELIKNGVAEERIEIFGHSYKEPLASNETEQGRAMNRRIEFVIKSRDNL